MTNVTIPNSVTSIGRGAFEGCTSLSAISVDASNVVYSSVDGVLFNRSQTILIQYPSGKAGAYMVPNSVISIGAAAFQRCTSLTDITIPNSVTSIEDHAFADCSTWPTSRFPTPSPASETRHSIPAPVSRVQE
jgi:hypothetical protein